MRIPSPYAVIPLILLADVAAKAMVLTIHGGVVTLIEGFLAIRLLYNPGLVLGLGAGPHGDPGALPMVINVVLLLALVGWAVRTAADSTRRHLGFACMIGGASGNLLDRVRYGAVVDFIDIRGLPVFNLADLALWLGTTVVIIDLLRTKPEQE